MQKIRLTKIFTFETGHALKNYDGLCKNLHGHSYKLHVTVIGSPIDDINNPKNGMVIDFGDLKAIVKSTIIDKYDHAMVLNESSRNDTNIKIDEKDYKLIYVPFQPTSENLIIYFAEVIQSHLPSSVKLHHLKLSETASSYAEWWASDNVANS